MILKERLGTRWGYFDTYIQNKPCTVKMLVVNPHEALSLQYHHYRDEYWILIEGHPHIKIRDREYFPEPGAEFSIGREEVHRIVARHDLVRIIEISTGHFDEKDIVRLEDKYGRR